MRIKTAIVIALLSTVLIHQNGAISESVPVIPKALMQEIRCMELNLHYEARGEGLKGLLAIAHVTRNRVMSGIFPSTYCGVVSQRGQFSWWTTRKNIPVDPNIRNLAMEFVLNIKEHRDITKGSLFFHHVDLDPFNRRFIAQIGNHVFYK
jgi:spore germination cell wall hydrolase CwlJ-like protein